MRPNNQRNQERGLKRRSNYFDLRENVSRERNQGYRNNNSRRQSPPRQRPQFKRSRIDDRSSYRRGITTTRRDRTSDRDDNRMPQKINRLKKRQREEQNEMESKLKDNELTAKKYCHTCKLNYRTPEENHLTSYYHISLEDLMKSRKDENDSENDSIDEINLTNMTTVDEVGVVDEIPQLREEKKLAGNEFITKIEVHYCNLCRIYLKRAGDEELIITEHCRTIQHLKWYALSEKRREISEQKIANNIIEQEKLKEKAEADSQIVLSEKIDPLKASEVLKSIDAENEDEEGIDGEAELVDKNDDDGKAEITTIETEEDQEVEKIEEGDEKYSGPVVANEDFIEMSTMDD
ncbi:unnamed protein product [Diamesa serratosioi]